MINPSSESKLVAEREFSSSHKEMREDGKTGSIEVAGKDAEGGAVFLNGVVIYAKYNEEVAEGALNSLMSCDCGTVRESSSTKEAVKMFRTYMRYISDDALLTAEPLGGADIDSYKVEGVIVGGVENTAGGSWGDGAKAVPGSWTSSSPGAEMPPRSLFPEGKRTALVADIRSLSRHVSRKGLTGYAAGDGEVITFSDGELVDKKRVDASSVCDGVGAGGGWVVVNTDPEPGDVGDDKKDRDEKKSEGILGRLF